MANNLNLLLTTSNNSINKTCLSIGKLEMCMFDEMVVGIYSNNKSLQTMEAGSSYSAQPRGTRFSFAWALPEMRMNLGMPTYLIHLT
ncbi:hypothetical protein EJ110_NYTH13251 [Nymphaea thermarum]|nr:hypothetical protein EJ110_NYTH13251 [Nymphaea thermarum]